MKSIITRSLLTGALIFLNATAFAGDKAGNGGDICEQRIQLIRDDIGSWIQLNGSQSLHLPDGLSLATYNSSMLRQIGASQIECVDHTLQIEEAEKTCINKTSNDRSLIRCNRQAFLRLKEDDQYILIHHEFAGLAGLELNDGGSSRYTISNQISGFLQAVVVKKLSVKRLIQQPPNELRKNFGSFTGRFKIVACTDRISNKSPQSLDVCKFPFAEIFFGGGYMPSTPGNHLFINMTSNFSALGSGALLAYEETAPDTRCSTFPGLQGCVSQAKGYSVNTSFKEVNGRVLLDWILVWPPDNEKYMYHSMSLTLERIP